MKGFFSLIFYMIGMAFIVAAAALAVIGYLSLQVGQRIED